MGYLAPAVCSDKSGST